MSTDGLPRLTAHIVATYLEAFRFQRFIWQAVHGLSHITLTDAQLRECIDDVCEYLRHNTVINGVPLTDYEHVWLKDQLIKKVMGPTKRLW